MPLLSLAVVSAQALPEPGTDVWRDRLHAAEIAYCTGLRLAGEHLAARFAARRAVARAMDWPGNPRWRDIAIRREPSGRPVVALSGALAAWRQERGLVVPGVSLTHAAGHGAALAWLPPGNPRG
jgi:phosphopantetheinyl transferase (holo-ACP synthase)